MKKFHFPLENVLDYKNQVLDSLQSEYASLLALVHQQEAVVEDLQSKYALYADEYRQKKREGLSVLDAIEYEGGLQTMEAQIQREIQHLETLKANAEKKRAEVVAARVDAVSIEKLKEKKISEYQKEVQKDEEHRVEEFVSATRSRAFSI
jgi:flagellar FliJ protein